jgi:TolB protein
MNADGTGLRQLTHDAGNSDYPAFSPDGTKIVFIPYRKGIGQVWLMNADGGQHPLTTSAGDKDQTPDWTRTASGSPSTRTTTSGR